MPGDGDGITLDDLLLHLLDCEDRGRVLEMRGEVEDERHLHLNGDTVDEEWFEFIAEGLLDAEVFEFGIVRVMLGCLANLAGAVGAGVDDHVAVGLAFVDWRPLDGGRVIDEALAFEGGNESGLDALVLRRGIGDNERSGVGLAERLEGRELADDGLEGEDVGLKGAGNLRAAEFMPVVEFEIAIEGEDLLQPWSGTVDAKVSPREVIRDAIHAVVATDARLG